MSLTSQVLLRLIWGCQGKYEACGQEKRLCESLTTTTCLILSPLSVNPVCPCMVYSQVWSTQQGQKGAGELWGNAVVFTGAEGVSGLLGTAELSRAAKSVPWH